MFSNLSYLEKSFFDENPVKAPDDDKTNIFDPEDGNMKRGMSLDSMIQSNPNELRNNVPQKEEDSGKSLQ